MGRLRINEVPLAEHVDENDKIPIGNNSNSALTISVALLKAFINLEVNATILQLLLSKNDSEVFISESLTQIENSLLAIAQDFDTKYHDAITAHNNLISIYANHDNRLNSLHDTMVKMLQTALPTSFKTINSESIVGEGNIIVPIIDATLTKENLAADAKAVGEKLKNVTGTDFSKPIIEELEDNNPFLLGANQIAYHEDLEYPNGSLGNKLNSIPTKTSLLENDSNFLTSHQSLSEYAKKTEIPTTLPASDVSSWAKQPSKPTYTASEVGALPSSTTIPTKTSQLQNDSNYLTEHQSLSDYEKVVDVINVSEDSLSISVGSQTRDTDYKCGVLNSLSVTSVTAINKEINVFFSTGDSVENMPSIPSETKIIGEIDINPNKNYIMSIYQGIIICKEIN